MKKLLLTLFMVLGFGFTGNAEPYQGAPDYGCGPGAPVSVCNPNYQNNNNTGESVKKEPVSNWKIIISRDSGKAPLEFFTMNGATENEAIYEMAEYCINNGSNGCEGIVYKKYGAVAITKDGVHYLARSEKSEEDAGKRVIKACEKKYKTSCKLVGTYN